MMGSRAGRMARAAAAALCAALVAAAFAAAGCGQAQAAQRAPSRGCVYAADIGEGRIHASVERAARAKGYQYEVSAKGCGTRRFATRERGTARSRNLDVRYWFKWDKWRSIRQDADGVWTPGRPFPVKVRVRAWSGSGGKRVYGRWSKRLTKFNWMPGTTEAIEFEDTSVWLAHAKRMQKRNPDWRQEIREQMPYVFPKSPAWTVPL